MNQKPSSTLPPLIHTIVKERKAYHRNLAYTAGIAACLAFVALIVVAMALSGTDVGFQLFLDIILFTFFAICVYYTFYNFKRKKSLDKSLYNGDFSVVRGQLEGIQRLPKKRARYIINGEVFEGTLLIPGFVAFQGIQIKDIIVKPGEAIALYLLPKGLIAGAVYPEREKQVVSRQANAEDWQIVLRRQWRGVVDFGVLCCIFLLVILGSIGFIQYREGVASWEMFGRTCAIFGAANIFFFGIHILLNMSEICALMNKNDVSVEVQVYRGVATECYRTEIRHRRGVTEDGWIRLAGGLHRTQHNLKFADNTFLNSLQVPMQVEYLSFKGRLIFLRSREEAC